MACLSVWNAISIWQISMCCVMMDGEVDAANAHAPCRKHSPRAGLLCSTSDSCVGSLHVCACALGSDVTRGPGLACCTSVNTLTWQCGMQRACTPESAVPSMRLSSSVLVASPHRTLHPLPNGQVRHFSPRLPASLAAVSGAGPGPGPGAGTGKCLCGVLLAAS